MKKSKRTKACEMQPIKKELINRDGGCIFCRMGYRPPLEPQWMFDAMHYIPRSRGGLGIPQNGAIGCRYHHQMMDQGSEGRRPEMLALFRGYLMERYPDWDEESLVYDRWEELKNEQSKERKRRRA